MFRKFFSKKEKNKDELKEESTIDEEIELDSDDSNQDNENDSVETEGIESQDEAIEEDIPTEEETITDDPITEDEVQISDCPEKEENNLNTSEDIPVSDEQTIEEDASQDNIDDESFSDEENTSLDSQDDESLPTEEDTDSPENEEKLEDSNLDISEAQDEEKKEKEGFFADFFKGLTKTRDNISSKIDEILSGSKKIDEELFENLEDILIMSDIGANSTIEIIENLRARVKEKKISEPEHVKKELNSIIKDYMNEDELDNSINIDNTPLIILVVGVNGVGKTTSIGKLAKKYTDSGKSVLLCAADTFRAAAIEQLGEWANRVGVDMISHSQNADPGAVVFDAIAAAKSRKTDILIVDTAGRLHNKKNLMDELNKIYRIIEREYSEAKLQTLMVLDATTGQNAMNQAKNFAEASHINGVILTKMDGTAKGGVVVRLQRELKVPIKYMGLGEGIGDLKEFNVNDFVDSII